MSHFIVALCGEMKGGTRRASSFVMNDLELNVWISFKTMLGRKAGSHAVHFNYRHQEDKDFCDCLCCIPLNLVLLQCCHTGFGSDNWDADLHTGEG